MKIHEKDRVTYEITSHSKLTELCIHVNHQGSQYKKFHMLKLMRSTTWNKWRIEVNFHFSFKDSMQYNLRIRVTLCTWIDNTQFTADTHTGNAAKSAQRQHHKRSQFISSNKFVCFN